MCSYQQPIMIEIPHYHPLENSMTILSCIFLNLHIGECVTIQEIMTVRNKKEMQSQAINPQRSEGYIFICSILGTRRPLKWDRLVQIALINNAVAC